jgi:hypothetical protein
MTLTPAEQQAVNDALLVPRDDPMGMRALARQHAAAGYLTRQDVMILNYPLMTNANPAVQALLNKMRAAASENEMRK